MAVLLQPHVKQYPRLQVLGLQVLVTGVAIGAWEIAARAGLLPKFFYSSPGSIIQTTGQWLADGVLLPNMLTTLQSALMGYVLGAVIGVALAFVLFGLPRVGDVLLPFVVAANAMPRLALLPFFVLWFGFGLLSKVLFIMLMVVFLVFLNVYNGLLTVRTDIVANAKILGAGRLEVVGNVYLPAVGVWVVAGLRSSIGFAFATAVVGEYMGSTSGLGYLILKGLTSFNTAQVFAGVVAVLVMVLVIDSLLRQVERRITLWKLA